MGGFKVSFLRFAAALELQRGEWLMIFNPRNSKLGVPKLAHVVLSDLNYSDN